MVCVSSFVGAYTIYWIRVLFRVRVMEAFWKTISISIDLILSPTNISSWHFFLSYSSKPPITTPISDFHSSQQDKYKQQQKISIS